MPLYTSDMYRVWWRLSVKLGGRDLKMDQHVVFQARTAGDISSDQSDLNIPMICRRRRTHFLNAFCQHNAPSSRKVIPSTSNAVAQDGKEKDTRYAKLPGECEATDKSERAYEPGWLKDPPSAQLPRKSEG